MNEPRLLKYKHSPSWDIDAYLQAGGYQGLEKCVTAMTRDEIIDEVRRSGLRGRGGAAFPTWIKFDKVLNHRVTEHVFVCNAGEHEPGTFKDRHLLRRNPHQVIEGCAIAAYTVNATYAAIYVNGDYAEEIDILKKAIALATDRGFLGQSMLGADFDLDLELFAGEGGYVAGEETAMLESMQGRPAMPRPKPPFYPTEFGLNGKPTLVNNVETLSNLPHIFREGAEWFSQVGTPQSPGTMVFSLSGSVKRPGIYELPLGTPLRELVNGCGRGVPRGHSVKAVFPGGPSFAMLPATQLDIPLDVESLKQAGSGLGSGGVIVVDDQTCIVNTVLHFLQFFKKESCGQCPPCRLGTVNLTAILQAIESGNGTQRDLDTLLELCGFVTGQGYCTLVTAATVLAQSSVQNFRDEYTTHLRERACSLNPWGHTHHAPAEIEDAVMAGVVDT